MLTTIISFIIVIGVLIFIHEFGHFIVAKYYGVRVEEFALGWGPKLFSRKKGETVYSLRAIPIGGFCNMTGEFIPDDDMDEEERKVYEEAKKNGNCFHQKTLWQRFAIIFTGAFMNFLLAVFVFIFIFMVYGFPMEASQETIIGDVNPMQPAAEAGLKPGDEITAINNIEVNDWQDMAGIIHDSDGQIEVDFIRENEQKTVRVTPEFDEYTENYVIGIYPVLIPEKVGVINSIKLGFIQTGQYIYMIIFGFIQMITGEVAAEVGGPVMIASIVGDAARTGLDRLLQWMAVISINLGIINLLPFPALDGGRILFLGIELIKGKPVNPAKETLVHFIGFVLLILLMVFIVYQDIVRSIL